MASKTVLRRGFKAEAERVSEKYRDQLGISKFDPLDAFSLAKHLDIPVVSVDLFQELSNGHLSILKKTDKFSATWMPNMDGDKIIIHNNYHSPKRQQSNIMHELSHIILGHEIPEEKARLCFLLNLHYYNTDHEQEAKYLGGCLQITRTGLLWALKRNMTEAEMSEHFNASVEMVKYRVNSTGVLIQRGYLSR